MTAMTMTRTRAALTRHLRDPVRGAGYALVSSSLISSGVGVLYWLVAARRYSEVDVGRGAAMIAAMTLVSVVAQLGLRNSLVRFVPTAGDGRRRLVALSYAATGTVALVGAVVTLTLLRSWTPELEAVGPSLPTIAWFGVATAAWTIFVLQDSVLTAIGRAGIVPLENLVFSVAKIALLVALASAFAGTGVFVSWTLPVIALVVPVSIYLFRSGLDRNPARGVEPISLPKMVRFTAGDYVASSLWNTTAWILPLIVLGMVGAEANAHYFLAWSTAYILFLVPSNIGHALIAQASREPARLIPHTRRALSQSAMLVVPAVVVGVVVAPWYLRLFGGDYEAEATVLLRLMLLAAIPNLAISTFVSVARVQLRVRAIMIAYGSIFVIMIAGTPIVLRSYDLDAVGVLWLSAETIVALGVLAAAFWSLWVQLPGPRITRALGRLRAGRGSPARVSEVEVTMAATSGDELVLKVARSASAADELDAAHDVMASLSRDPRATPVVHLVPRVIESGDDEGNRFLTETRLPGVELSALLGDPRRTAAISAAAAAISRLHKATARQIMVTEDVLDTWFVDRARGLGPLLSGRQRDTLERIGERVRAGLLGRTVIATRVHGDLAPGNVLLDPTTLEVTGLVDWGNSQIDELPDTDVAHLLLTTRAESTHSELGPVVLDALLSGWHDEDTAVLDVAPSRLNSHIPDDVVVILTWLSHVSNTVRKTDSYATNRVWVARNIGAVLDAAETQPTVGAGGPR